MIGVVDVLGYRKIGAYNDVFILWNLENREPTPKALGVFLRLPLAAFLLCEVIFWNSKTSKTKHAGKYLYQRDPNQYLCLLNFSFGTLA